MCTDRSGYKFEDIDKNIKFATNVDILTWYNNLFINQCKYVRSGGSSICLYKQKLHNSEGYAFSLYVPCGYSELNYHLSDHKNTEDDMMDEYSYCICLVFYYNSKILNKIQCINRMNFSDFFKSIIDNKN